jgi:hypothetical protein
MCLWLFSFIYFVCTCCLHTQMKTEFSILRRTLTAAVTELVSLISCYLSDKGPAVAAAVVCVHVRARERQTETTTCSLLHQWFCKHASSLHYMYIDCLVLVVLASLGGGGGVFLALSLTWECVVLSGWMINE